MHAANGLVIAGVSLFILMFIPMNLLFMDTTPAGGDTASHTSTLIYLKNHLLPQGRISGWYTGNLGGFPLLQNYFFLPFLVMSVLSYVMPLSTAFKVVSVFGIFGLPPAVFFFFRKMKQPWPVPQTATILTLPYLFMEGQSIWGGNIASSLSGTFCYAAGLCFSLVFLGFLYEHFTEKSHLGTCAVILALTGFSHGYALLFCGFGSLFFLLTKSRFKTRLKDLIFIHGTAIALMAFWLYPLIRYLPWTTPFGFAWNFQGVRGFLDQVFPAMVRPFVLLTFSGFSAWIVRRACLRHATSKAIQNQNINDSNHCAILFTAFLALTALGLYAGGSQLKLVDIRFLPFFQLFAVVGGAFAFPRSKTGHRTVYVFLVFFMSVVMLWVEGHETYIRNWSIHNNKGFENMPLWHDYDALMKKLKGTANDPRIVYENSPVYNHAGTLRAMESLPFFSSRSTLEGVYIQASILSPAIYAIQAEISRHPSMPLVEYTYPGFDLSRAAEHLRMFNVSQLILTDPESRQAARQHPDFSKDFSAGPFEVFTVKNNSGKYVEPLKYKPRLISGPDFRKPFYAWMQSGETDMFLVYDRHPGLREKERFVNAPASVRKALPAAEHRVESEFLDQAIHIRNAKPGHPLLVKVSYHPGWQVTGADRIYPVSPGFMLIYPEKTDIRLSFEPTTLEHIAVWISFSAFFILCSASLYRWYEAHRRQHD